MTIKVTYKPQNFRVKQWWFKAEKPNQIQGIESWETIKPVKFKQPPKWWVNIQTMRAEEPDWVRE